MLFNSYVFLFLFLPLTLAVFAGVWRWIGREAAIFWLVLASLFYYGWWEPSYVVLIVGSMTVNYWLGQLIVRKQIYSGVSGRSWLVVGVVLNLALLAYFKYTVFLAGNIFDAVGVDFSLPPIVLPLAISFFTFQQIAYLADAYSGQARSYNFLHYALFVTFFPQLIAGPIVHHREMMPQFERGSLSPRARNLAVGGTIFAIGLFKKVVLADGVAAFASPVFAAAQQGADLTLLEAWGGALAYTFQLYFDFSGYSDMAIGSARLFGIRLPLNFFSPYKAASIIEFWRRWHITLSRFLRDYLYIPLGGNRRGRGRRYGNLMITMALGGLWHGAGWTFVLWGLLHGTYLVVNHLWHWLSRRFGLEGFRSTSFWRAVAWAMTFVAIVVGWVFFRAESLDAALVMLRGMAGLNGIALPNALVARLGPDAAALLNALGVDTYLGGGRQFVQTYLWVAALLALSVSAPNTAQLLRRYRPVVEPVPDNGDYAIEPLGRPARLLCWRPNWQWSLGLALVSAAGILGLTSISEFLYFQF